MTVVLVFKQTLARSWAIFSLILQIIMIFLLGLFSCRKLLCWLNRELQLGKVKEDYEVILIYYCEASPTYQPRSYVSVLSPCSR